MNKTTKYVLGAIGGTILLVIVAVLLFVGIPGTASFERNVKGLQTEFATDSVYREMEVVGRAGDLIFETEGHFDVEFSDNRLRWVDEQGDVHLIYLGDSATVIVNETGSEEYE